MLIHACPFTRSFNDEGLTYKVQNGSDIQLGSIVVVPFGKHLIDAVVIALNIQNSEIDPESIKEIDSVKYIEPFMFPYQITLLHFLSQQYFTLLHNSLSLFFPRNLKEKIGKQTCKFTEQGLAYTTKKQTLSPLQEEKFQEILHSSENINLLYGVTGSGKTNIYIALIQTQLSQDKQTLLLVPEIILSSQVAGKISNFFGEDVLIINSSVSEAKKTKARMSIYSGEAKVIVGTRSSLFYPYSNLGMIIIDEEHDRSYKSDNNPRYDAREIAFTLSNELDIPLVLGSGTPSINMMYKAIKKRIGLITLLEEYK